MAKRPHTTRSASRPLGQARGATSLGELNLEAAAKQAAGNWKKFESFAWTGQPENPDDWTLQYVHNRDSETLEKSNAAAIENEMKPFLKGKGALDKNDPDLVEEHHGHWAVGWIEGYSIRVFNRKGKITPAFEAFHALMERKADYPVLDESDFMEREMEEKWETAIGIIEHEARNLIKDKAPKDWAESVMSYLGEKANTGASLGAQKFGWERARDHIEEGRFDSNEREAVVEALKALKLLDPEAEI